MSLCVVVLLQPVGDDLIHGLTIVTSCLDSDSVLQTRRQFQPCGYRIAVCYFISQKFNDIEKVILPCEREYTIATDISIIVCGIQCVCVCVCVCV